MFGFHILELIVKVKTTKTVAIAKHILSKLHKRHRKQVKTCKSIFSVYSEQYFCAGNTID